MGSIYGTEKESSDLGSNQHNNILWFGGADKRRWTFNSDAEKK